MVKPKIKDGVKFYNITSKNKIEANRLFEKKLTEIFNLETKAKGSPLTTREVSKLRNHPDLGVWVIDGKPASVTDLNAFLVSGKKKTLSLHIPKERTGYTRKYLESPKNMNREVKKWFDRLDKQGWPKGTSKKGFTNFLTRSYDQTAEYNKILEKQLGFKFDAGHFWGAMGPEGNRTIIGPYGFRSEGKFTFRNVTSQPRTPSMKQLLNPKWNVITPNVPGFFDKAGAQIASAEDLLNVGGGGQGWHGALADYLTQGLNDIDKMSAWEKAYIAFGDPSKGAGATTETRLAELLEPGGRDKILQRVGEFTETAEDLSGPARTITKGSEEWWKLQEGLLSNASKTGVVGKKLLKASFIPVVGSLLAPGIVKAAEERQEENPNVVNWTQLQLERASQFGSNLSTAGLAGVVTPEPVSTAVGAGAVVVGETIDTAASVPSLLIDFSRYVVKHAQNPLTDEELKKEFQKTDDYLGPNFGTL